MKKSMKKLLALVLVLCMAAGVAGCSGQTAQQGSETKAESETEKAASESAAAGQESTETAQIDTSEHVVVTFMTIGEKPTNGKVDAVLEKINAVLNERVNAELEIYWVSWTDYLTNYNLTLAQMDGTVDMTITGTDWLDAWPNAKRGAFLELSEEMLSTYAPLTWEAVTKEHWDACKYNGEIYFIPEDQYTQWTNHGFLYRGDIAKEAGFENGLHSWEDMTAYFQYVKDNYPDMVPWDVPGNAQTANQLTDGWIKSNSDYVLVEGLEVPLFYGTSHEDPYTLTSPFIEGQELIDFAINQKAWGDAGFWRSDVLNSEPSTQEEFEAGQTAAHQHHTSTWLGRRSAMDESMPGSDIGFFWFGEETKNLTKSSISHGAMAISAGSKNPERTLMVYDILRNDKEIYQLFNFGIEGEQYLLDENGQYYRPEGYTDEKDGVFTNFWGGRNDEFELSYVTEYKEGKEALYAEYDQYAQDYPYSIIVFDTTNVKTEMSNLSAVYTEYLPRIAFGKVDDPEAYVAEFREQLKAAGYDTVIAELQRQLDSVK